MKNFKTLVVLSPGFPASEADTTCLPAQQSLVRCINNAFPDIQVVILAFQYPFEGSEYLWNGNRVIPFNGQNRKRLQRWKLWLRCLRTLKKLEQEENIIGLFSFWLDECAFIGDRFSKRSGLPHFTWLLGQDARQGNLYVKRIRPRASSLVAISDFLAKTFEENYGIRPQHIVPNGIDPDLYPSPPSVKDIDLIGVGSLIPLKRYGMFIDIVYKLRKHDRDIKAIICGKGPEEEKLTQRIHELQLENNIILYGEADHNTVLALLQRSKVLLHTSSYEGFSGACLEALYAGAHVISFVNPQDAWIRHWHIVKDEHAMLEQATEILQSDKIDYTPSLPYKMSDTAKAIMQLFLNQ